jgi:type I restriction enzyme, S subunit
MSWEKVKLGQIVKMVTGKTPPTNNLEYFEGEYLWVNPPDFKRKIISESKRTVSRKAIDEKKCTLLPIGTVLLSCIGDIGKIGIIKTIGTSNQQITGLIPNERVCSDYLYYYLLHNKHKLESLANKAVVSILNNERLKELEVTLPPLETQKRIADILDAADALRQKDQELLKKYDELAQAIFIDMFGDPVKNEKGWEVKKLNEVCIGIFGGGTPSKANPEFYKGDIPWVTPKDMKSEIISDSIDHVSEEAISNSSTKLVPPYSVLMVIRSGILKHTLPVAINDKSVTMNQDMKAFIPQPSITNSIFLKYFFNSVSGYLLSKVRAVTADNIEFDEIKYMSFICPPLELQKSFSDIIVNIQKQNNLFVQNNSNSLFLTLLQKAFNGGLEV